MGVETGSAGLRPPPYSTGKPTRFPGRQKPSQFRSVSEACRGLRTEFRPFSRILRLKSPASLCPQNSVSRTTRWRGRSRGFAFGRKELRSGRLARPITAGAVRYPGLKIHEPRVVRLFEVLLHGGPQIGGWTARQIHQAVLDTFDLSEKTYRLNQLRYDLRKLKLIFDTSNLQVVDCKHESALGKH